MSFIIPLVVRIHTITSYEIKQVLLEIDL